VGRGWGKRMMDWHKNITLQAIDNNEMQWQENWKAAHSN